MLNKQYRLNETCWTYEVRPTDSQMNKKKKKNRIALLKTKQPIAEFNWIMKHRAFGSQERKKQRKAFDEEEWQR